MTDAELDAIEARRAAFADFMARMAKAAVDAVIHGEAAVEKPKEKLELAYPGWGKDNADLLAEARLLNKLLADMQGHSEAYNAGLEAGRKERPQRGEHLKKPHRGGSGWWWHRATASGETDADCLPAGVFDRLRSGTLHPSASGERLGGRVYHSKGAAADDLAQAAARWMRGEP